MKDSSSKLTIAVIAACLVVILICLILGPFRKADREEMEPSGKTPSVARPAPEPSPEGPPSPPPSPPGPEPPEPTEVVESPEVGEELDISGIVVDKDGAPLEGTTVQVVFYSWDQFSDMGRSFARDMKPLKSVTKEDGRFGFEYQKGKRYFLSAEKEDYIAQQKNLAEPRKEIVITLTLGGAIEGNVVDAVSLEPVTHFRIVGSEGIPEGLLVGLFSKREVDIYLPTDGKEFNDPEGKFRVSGLNQGKYSLVSIAEGYAQSRSKPVEVKLEETTTGVVIKQKAGGGIRGHVVDAIGKPIEGAQVTQKNPIQSELLGEISLPQRKVLSTADAKGEFEVDGLPAGKFTLQARHKDYCPADQEVKINHGEFTEGVEFQLVQGGMLSGVVLAKVDMQPVAGATVQASTSSSFLIPDMSAPEVKTDQNGFFDIIKLEPGTYSLIVSAEDFAEKTVEELTLAENDAITDLIIELSQGGSLVGTVKDLSGKPLPKMMIVAVGPGGRKMGQTDDQGNFAMINMKEGVYTAGAIEISPELMGFGASQSNMHFVRVENDKETRLDITVGGTRKVYGKVTLKGEPQKEVIVAVQTSPKRIALDKQQVQAMDRTDEDGRYEIANLQPGEYSLGAMKIAGMMPKPLYSADIVLSDSDLEKNIELPEGGVSGEVRDARTRQPIEGAKVTLEETNAEDIQTAALAKIGMFGGGGETTDAEGKFSFSIVEDGDYSVVASKEGYAPQALAASVRNSRGPSDLDFSLKAGETLSGRVTGSTPSIPIKQIYLTAKDDGGRVVYGNKLKLTEQGEYETAGLAPGEYTVSVDATGYASASQKVRIRSGADNQADFTLTAGGTLIIRGTDDRGQPIPGMQAEIMDEQGGYFLGFFPDLQELMTMGFEEIMRQDGVSVSRNLPEGKYRAKVSAIGYEEEWVDVVVREGQETDRTVTLQKSR